MKQTAVVEPDGHIKIAGRVFTAIITITLFILGTGVGVWNSLISLNTSVNVLQERLSAFDAKYYEKIDDINRIIAIHEKELEEHKKMVFSQIKTVNGSVNEMRQMILANKLLINEIKQSQQNTESTLAEIQKTIQQ